MKYLYIWFQQVAMSEFVKTFHLQKSRNMIQSFRSAESAQTLKSRGQRLSLRTSLGAPGFGSQSPVEAKRL